MHTSTHLPRISIFLNAKSERVYKASTGLSIEEFSELANAFGTYYKPTKLEDIVPEYGIASSLQDPEEVLFLMLYHHKTAVTYDVLGICFGLSTAVAFSYVNLGKQILKQVLAEKDALPKRIFSSKDELDAYFLNVDDLNIDATECPTQRPVNQQVQEERYTSKKNITA